jgi:hypothetical protein
MDCYPGEWVEPVAVRRVRETRGHSAYGFWATSALSGALAVFAACFCGPHVMCQGNAASWNVLKSSCGLPGSGPFRQTADTRSVGVGVPAPLDLTGVTVGLAPIARCLPLRPTGPDCHQPERRFRDRCSRGVTTDAEQLRTGSRRSSHVGCGHALAGSCSCPRSVAQNIRALGGQDA